MAEIRVKSSVEPVSLLLVAGVANVAAPIICVPTVVITAGRDGRHMNGSRHYDDAAIDVRTKNFPTRKAKEAFLDALRRKFQPPDYDVLFEYIGCEQEHIHVERQVL